MANIVFDFEADPSGVLAAVDAISGALEQLGSLVENVSSQFAQINTIAETMSSGWGDLFSTFGQSADNTAQATGRASKSAMDLQYQLAQLGQTAQDSAQQHAYAVQQIQQDEGNLTQNTQDEIAKRTQAYQDSMQQLQMQHADMVQNICDQEQQLTVTYQETIDRINLQMSQLTGDHTIRLQEMNNQIAMATADNQQRAQQYQTQIEVKQLEIQQIQQQIQLAYDNGNMNQVVSLQTRLEVSKIELQQEQDNETNFINTTSKLRMDDLQLRKQQLNLQYTDSVKRNELEKASATEKYNYEIRKLQEKLGNENKLYDFHIQELKQKYATDLHNIEVHYQQAELKLQEHLARENQLYADQQAKQALQRQHYLDVAAYGSSSGSGGSGTGTYTVGLTPPKGDKSIQLFSQLGIDMNADPSAAGQALNAWLLGGSYGGKQYGQGIRGTTNLTSQQAMTVANMGIAGSIDPTRDLGGGRNFVQMFSDMLAYTGVRRPEMSQNQRFGQMQYAMEEIIAGNTGVGLRSLDRLGISKAMLERGGGQFNTRGQMTNAADIIDVMSKTMEGGGGVKGAAPGLGQVQATSTMAGLEAGVTATWQRILLEIGQPFDNKGLWAQFEAQLRRIFGLFVDNEPTIVHFGQTIFKSVITVLTDFVNWLTSSQAQSMFHAFANALHEIGDAFAWIANHKDIIILLMGLGAANVVGKIGMGLANPGNLASIATALVPKPFQGGPLGAIAGGLGNLMFGHPAPSDAATAAYEADQAARNPLTASLARATTRQSNANNVVSDLQSLLGYTPNPTLGPMHLNASKRADQSAGLLAWLPGVLSGGATPPASMGSTWSHLMRNGATPEIRREAAHHMRWGGGTNEFQGMIDRGIMAPMGYHPGLPADAALSHLEGMRAGTAIPPGTALFNDLTGKIAGAQQDFNHFDQLKNALAGQMGYTPNHPLEAQLSRAQGVAGRAGQDVMGLGRQLTGLGPEVPMPTPGPSLFNRMGGAVGGIFTGIGNRFAAGKDTGQRFGDLMSHLRGGGLQAAASAAPATGGAFESIAQSQGVSKGTAIMAGMLTNPFTTLNQTIEPALEKVSRTIMGNFSYIQGFLSTAVGKIGSLFTNMPNIFTGLKTAIMGIGPFLMGLPGMFMGVVTSMGPFLVGLAAAAGPILLITGLVAGLIALFVMNRAKILPFINMLAHFFNVELKMAAKAVIDFAKGFMDRFHSIFAPGTPIYGFIMMFAKFWAGAWNGIKMVFEGVWKMIESIIKVAWSIIKGVIYTFLDLISGKWGKAWDDIKNMFSGIWNGIKEFLSGAIQAIVGVITGFVGGLWGMVSGGLGTFLGNFGKWTLGLLGFVMQLIPNMIAFFIQMPGKIWDAITGLLAGLANDIIQAFLGIPSALASKLDFFKMITDALMKVADIGRIIMKFLIDHAGALGWAIQQVAGWLGFKFEQGGYYPGGQVAMVGEAGPELFFSDHAGTVVSNADIMKAVSQVGAKAFYPGSFSTITTNSGQTGGSNGCVTISGPVTIVANDPLEFMKKLNQLQGRMAEYGGYRGSLA